MFENAVQSVQEGGQDVGKTYKSQLESVQDCQEAASRKGCAADCRARPDTRTAADRIVAMGTGDLAAAPENTPHPGTR